MTACGTPTLMRLRFVHTFAAFARCFTYIFYHVYVALLQVADFVKYDVRVNIVSIARVTQDWHISRCIRRGADALRSMTRHLHLPYRALRGHCVYLCSRDASALSAFRAHRLAACPQRPFTALRICVARVPSFAPSAAPAGGNLWAGPVPLTSRTRACRLLNSPITSTRPT